MRKVIYISVFLLLILSIQCVHRGNNTSDTEGSNLLEEPDTILFQVAPEESATPKHPEKPILTYSYEQLDSIRNIIYAYLTGTPDKYIKDNVVSVEIQQEQIIIRMISTGNDLVSVFREKVVDSPLVVFKEIVSESIPEDGVSETETLALQTEYAVYATTTDHIQVILYNRGQNRLQVGAHFRVGYEQNGKWKLLPLNYSAPDIGYLVYPGYNHFFTISLLPHITPYSPGRYRVYYNVTEEGETRQDIKMMTEFTLSNDPSIYTKVTPQTYPNKNIPSFPGGIHALKDYLNTHLKYPDSLLESLRWEVVLCKLTIDNKGIIETIDLIEKSDFPEFNEEALRVLQEMPPWEPARSEHETKEGVYYLSISFMPPDRRIKQ